MFFEQYENLRDKLLGKGVVIAIDGPSGSGKSTIARNAAAALDLCYLDTGAMYRGAAWWVDHQGINLRNTEMVEKSVGAMDLVFNTLPHAPRIFVEGIDVSQAIRTQHINEIVSMVSSLPGVRRVLIAKQRELIDKAKRSTRGIVVEGRDITTVVAPDADVRILLTADPQTRLARRALENHGDADSQSLQREKALVLDRDASDAKVTNFMQAAPGVTEVDSSAMSVEQTLDAVMQLIDQTTN